MIDANSRLEIWCGDSKSIDLPDDAADLCFFSPPYEDARTYRQLAFKLKREAWVAWMVERMAEYHRVCKGLVGCVVNGRTRKFAWSGTPFKLWVALEEAGYLMRKPPLYQRKGIFGSGGPDWLSDDYEPVVCSQKRPGRLPWSDNTAMGHPPKFKPGGAPTYRNQKGERVHKVKGAYKPPAKANPGNVIHCTVGGGHMGHPLAHENDAPFPERLAEFFVRSFCPPDGVVFDPMGGSGTTAAVALKAGRRCVSMDIRLDQCQLMQRRLVAELGILPPPIKVFGPDGKLERVVDATDLTHPDLVANENQDGTFRDQVAT